MVWEVEVETTVEVGVSAVGVVEQLIGERDVWGCGFSVWLKRWFHQWLKQLLVPRKIVLVPKLLPLLLHCQRVFSH